jgi:hypothetical protein
MEAYEQTTAGSRFKTDVTSNSLHSWEEVLEEVNRAAETYNSRATVWCKIRVSLRRLGDNSKVFQAWAVLLPAGSDCATMISGGLKLILSVGGCWFFTPRMLTVEGRRTLGRSATGSLGCTG